MDNETSTRLVRKKCGFGIGRRAGDQKFHAENAAPIDRIGDKEEETLFSSKRQITRRPMMTVALGEETCNFHVAILRAAAAATTASLEWA